MRIVWKSPKKHGMMKLSQCRTAERYSCFYETEVRLWRGVRFGKTFLRKRFWPSLLPDFLLREFQLGVIFLDGLRRFLLCHGWSLLSDHRQTKRAAVFCAKIAALNRWFTILECQYLNLHGLIAYQKIITKQRADVSKSLINFFTRKIMHC